MARNYTGEYNNYQGTPAQRRRNDARKTARRKMVAAGAVKRVMVRMYITEMVILKITLGRT